MTSEEEVMDAIEKEERDSGHKSCSRNFELIFEVYRNILVFFKAISILFLIATLRSI